MHQDGGVPDLERQLADARADLAAATQTAGLLGEVFEQAPAPLLVLDRDGTIRRANHRAGDLLGGAAGRLLTTFVDLPDRAAAGTQLAAAARTGRQQSLRCGMLGASGPFDAILTIAALQGAQRLLVVAVGRDVLGRVEPRVGEAPTTELVTSEVSSSEVVPGEAVLDNEAARVVQAMTQRLDLVTAATRLLLDNATFSEAVTLRRCARLLAGELASWVVVDVDRRQRLRRQVVIGPGDRVSADLGLVEELGQQLGLAIRVDRMFRRRSEIADSLQASLLPAELPVLPGVEFAAAYEPATYAEGVEVGGDFYDVYPSPGGWGIAIGDVCGKGEDAAAVTAAARHAIRVLAHWNPDPADVLDRANQVLLSDELDARFVTACAGYLRWDTGRLQVAMASAGHPAPMIIRADGHVQPLRGGGMVLGVFPDAAADAEDVELRDGDLLVMFTDGVTEARSPEMEYFEARLPGELARLAGRSAEEVVAALRAQVLEFSASELRDDVTILVLRAGA
jgi:serine phosphatase RsbU (regulator of sigma subunit)